MPTNPVDPDRSARHGQQRQAPERDAWFKGSRVRLNLNAEAAAQLRDALDRVARSDPSRSSAVAGLDVRLPDGRPLRLSPRSEQEAAALDADRVDQALDGRAPTAKALDDQTRNAVRARAQQAADQTRDQRIADVVRRSRDLGIGWDR